MGKWDYVQHLHGWTEEWKTHQLNCSWQLALFEVSSQVAGHPWLHVHNWVSLRHWASSIKTPESAAHWVKSRRSPDPFDSIETPEDLQDMLLAILAWPCSIPRETETPPASASISCFSGPWDFLACTFTTRGTRPIGEVWKLENSRYLRTGLDCQNFVLLCVVHHRVLRLWKNRMGP